MVMSPNIAALRETVQATIDEGRLGKASFMRCVARVQGPARLEGGLDELGAIAEGWFGSPHERRYRQGEGSGLYLTEMLRWRNGQGALLIVTSAPSKGARDLDVMLVGSRGTLFHES